MNNVYLVVLRCTMDDLPIKLHAEYGPALVQATDLGIRLGALGDSDPTPDEVSMVEDILGLDASSFHSVAIITFTDGVPTEFEQVCDFTGMGDDLGFGVGES